MNSRDKGKRGERSLASLLTAEGFPARRGVQYQGGPGSPDVVCDALSWVHFECKVTERLQLYEALEQAKNDAAPSKFPVVAHKKNNKEWVACLRLTDLLEILRESTYCGTIKPAEAEVVELSKAFGAEP